MPWKWVAENVQYLRVVWYMPWRGVAENVKWPEVETHWVVWYIAWKGVVEDVQCPKSVCETEHVSIGWFVILMSENVYSLSNH